MKKNLTITIFTLLSLVSQSYGEEIPHAVQKIQKQRFDAIKKIDKIYVSELEKLKSSYLKSEDLVNANLVNALIVENHSQHIKPVTKPVTKPNTQKKHLGLIIGSWKSVGEAHSAYTFLDEKGKGYFRKLTGKQVPCQVTYYPQHNKYLVSARAWNDSFELVNENTIIVVSQRIGKYVMTKVK